MLQKSPSQCGRRCQPILRCRYLIGRNFNDRTFVHLPSIDHIISNSKEYDGKCDQARPVHMRRIRIHLCRKETEDDDNSTVTDRPSVEHDPPDARDMEGSPDKLVGFPDGSAHLAGFSNVATDAAPEQESLCDGVRTIEGGDADGEDDVECRGRAQIDDADEAGDTGHNIDGVERDCGLRVHLFVDEN